MRENFVFCSNSTRFLKNNRAKTSRSRDEKFLDGLSKNSERVFQQSLISTSGKCHAFRRAQIAEPFLRRFLLRSRRKTGRFSRLRRGNRHENGRQDACGEVRGISPTGAKRAVKTRALNCAVLPIFSGRASFCFPAHRKRERDQKNLSITSASAAARRARHSSL